MNTTILRAFHNDQTIKDKYLKRLRAHIKADDLVRGLGWENGKGCAVGCTLEKYEHAAYETELGISQALARLEDCIFEGLTNGDAQKFTLRFLSVIPVGADLSLVAPRFIHWMLVDQTHGVIRFANTDQCRAAIQGVADLYAALIKGEYPSWSARSDAASAALNARNATWSAESAANAARAANAASAANAAASAARSAVDAAASAARSAAYKTMAKYLLKLLREA